MNQVATKDNNPVVAFSRFMDKFKPQMALALPKHLTADRMARLALTAFSSNSQLQECDPHTIAASVMTASTLGLEPGVNGQGFLVPYKDRRRGITVCQFIPGWKGLVDIANRSGRCTVWTGAVFAGDEFDFALGDNPFIKHKPGDEDEPSKITHVYAVGRVNGSQWPVLEVWTIKKVWKHRNAYNKVGDRHYSFRDPEMYARKVPLLQVLKYMPSSVELSNAIALNNAAEMGQNAIIDGNFVTITDPVDEGADSTSLEDQDSRKTAVDMPKAKAKPATAADAADPATGEIREPAVGGEANAAGPAAASPAAAPAAPARAPRREEDNSAQATDGERKMILNRVRSNELDLDELLREVGLAHLVGVADLQGLTKDGFIALKDALPKAA